MYVNRASFIGILAICAGGASSLTLAQQVATTPAIRDVRPVAFPRTRQVAASPYLRRRLPNTRKRYKLKIVYGEEHVSPGRARERHEDAVRWFRRFDEPPSTP